MVIYNDESQFKLSSGQCINDTRLSKIMYEIANKHPERKFQDDSTGYSWDEAGTGDLFAELYFTDTRYCPEHKTWYTYDEGVWVKDTGSLLVSAKIKEFVRLLALYCGEITDELTRNDYMKFVAKMGDRRFRDRMMKDAADSMRIEASTFDSNPYLINCLNCTYDLKTHTVHEHTYKDYLTMRANVEYGTANLNKTCDRWLEFISEVTEGDKEKAKYLQKALGYSLLGMSNEECMFILHGRTTRNGKSTLLNTIDYLLGDYSSVAPVELITKGDRKNAEAPSPVLAGLKGRRFVTMAESDSAGKIDESVLKQYTGGECITARELHQSPVTFLPQFTLWLSCNDLPSVRDRSLFASDRLRVIEFNRHFTDAEQDKDLKRKLESKESRKGIFTWLIEGYKLYKKEGLHMTEGLQKVVNQYEKDNDVMLQFLEEMTERSEDKIKGKTLYENYKVWCKSNGYYTVSMKKFHAEMSKHPERYESKGVAKGVAWYYGITMKGE